MTPALKPTEGRATREEENYECSGGRCPYLLVFMAAIPGAGQTVLFDGMVHEHRQADALLAPAVITADDHSLLARLEYGGADRVNLFGGRFNSGATALPGVGWAAAFYRQTDAFPLNFGVFNSLVFPLKAGGPDALVMLAPVFSYPWGRSTGARVIHYGGVTTTFKVNKPGRAARPQGRCDPGRLRSRTVLGVSATEGCQGRLARRAVRRTPHP